MTGTTHRRDIEGLRAVAVLLVVAYHCGLPIAGGGYVGVDVFFVISGFLITGLLLREIRGTGRLSVPGFYARRAMRLLPAATVVVVSTVAGAVWLLPPLRHGDVLTDALYTLGYGVNYRLAVVGTDYLAGTDPSPLQHFWSLAVEEQFYLVWPLLLLALIRLRPGYAALVALVVVSLLLSVWQTGADANWAYFGAHTRAWELGTGALVAVGADRLATLSRRTARLLGGAGLSAIGVSAVLYTGTTPFPGSAALLPVLGAAAVIAAGGVRPSRLLSAPAWQGIGRLSYSWYLWHWPVLVLLPAWLGHPAAWWQNVAAALLAFGAAMLTYALVENPLRRLRSLRHRPRRALLTGGGMSVLAAGLCLLITGTAAWTAQAPAYRAAPETVDGGTPGWQAALQRATRLRAVPANLTPSLRAADRDQPRLRLDGCDPEATDSTVRTPCEYGDTASATTVVLFGDSHAGHWFAALERLSVQRHWKLVVVTKSGCSAADSLIHFDLLKRAYHECVAWRQAAWERIRSLRPATVFLSSVGTGPMLNAPDQDTAWASGWASTLDHVSGPGTRTVLITDTPWQAGNVPDCLSAHLNAPQACARDRAAALLEPRRRRLVTATARAHGATVIDPTDWFCTPTTCPVIVGNVLVYKDGHHMTSEYSRMLAPLLSAAVR